MLFLKTFKDAKFVVGCKTYTITGLHRQQVKYVYIKCRSDDKTNSFNYTLPNNCKLDVGKPNISPPGCATGRLRPATPMHYYSLVGGVA